MEESRSNTSEHFPIPNRVESLINSFTLQKLCFTILFLQIAASPNYDPELDDEIIEFAALEQEDDVTVPMEMFEASELEESGPMPQIFEPLFLQSPHTLLVFCITIYRLVLHSNLSKAAADSLLHTYAIFFPQPNNVPKNYACLRKILGLGSAEMNPKFHCVNPECKNYKVFDEKGTCATCNKPHGSKFLCRGLIPALQERLSTPSFWEKANWQQKNLGNCNFLDITKSPYYLTNFDAITRKKGNYTGIAFTDGGSPFNSSNASVWPLLTAINEIDPEVRFNPENVILLGF